jgi:hypothetical protein
MAIGAPRARLLEYSGKKAQSPLGHVLKRLRVVATLALLGLASLRFGHSSVRLTRQPR